MFPSMFGNDPFFMNPSGLEEMDRMMGGFHSPLFDHPLLMPNPSRMLQIDNGIGGSHQPLPGFLSSPFAGMMGGMNSMHSMMRNMQRGMVTPHSFPSMGGGSHSFSSSTVIMHNDGSGPRVIESSSSARMGPDGVKETRRSHKDSGTGEMRMAIGHHIDERAHIIEKSKNRKTGDQEEKQEYINIEEDDAGTFNEEWMRKMPSSSAPRQNAQRSIAYHHPSSSRHEPYQRHQQHHRRRPHTAAITYNRPTEQPEPKHRRYVGPDGGSGL